MWSHYGRVAEPACAVLSVLFPAAHQKNSQPSDTGHSGPCVSFRADLFASDTVPVPVTVTVLPPSTEYQVLGYLEFNLPRYLCTIPMTRVNASHARGAPWCYYITFRTLLTGFVNG